jgi:hypothetical protein
MTPLELSVSGRHNLEHHLQSSITLLESSVMLPESSITLLENIQSTGITLDDHNMFIVQTSTLGYFQPQSFNFTTDIYNCLDVRALALTIRLCTVKSYQIGQFFANWATFGGSL